MTIRLRAHHLLCMLTYVGRGYSPEFTANYDAVIERLGAGETILIVEGPDDVCAPLLTDVDPHCVRDGVDQRDARAARAVAELLSRPVGPGAQFRLDAAIVGTMRQAFRERATRAACRGCDWARLCTSVAESDFQDVRLHRAAAEVS